MEERLRFTYVIHVAAPLKILEIYVTARFFVVTEFRSRYEPEDLFELRFFTRNRQRTDVRETVFFFGIHQKLLENRMIQVRRSHDKPSAIDSDADRYVPSRHITCDAPPWRWRGSTAPTAEHLSDSDNVVDPAWLLDRRWHLDVGVGGSVSFFGCSCVWVFCLGFR